VNLKMWGALDAETRAIIAHACAAEASYALSEMERLNAQALVALTERDKVKLRSFAPDIVAAARRHASDILSELAAESDIARRINESYSAFRKSTAAWSSVSLKAVLEAREG
jgi:TRAP-type mannitol/chloroaromatic compound transport system substrate-binding protein